MVNVDSSRISLDEFTPTLRSPMIIVDSFRISLDEFTSTLWSLMVSVDSSRISLDEFTPTPRSPWLMYTVLVFLLMSSHLHCGSPWLM